MTAEDIIRQALDGKFFHYIGKPVHEGMYGDEHQQKLIVEAKAKAEAEKRLKRQQQLRPQREIMLQPRADGPTTEQVMAAVGLAYDLTIGEICCKSRRQLVTRARHHMAWELRYRRNYSTLRIGELLGRDHTTIVNSLQFVRRNMKMFADKMARVTEMIGKING